MKNQQKALVVMAEPGQVHGLDELNIALRRGWRVARIASMGGAGVGVGEGTPTLCFAALVIIERTDTREADLLEQTEEQIEEAVDDLVEGDGSSAGLEEL